MPLPKLNLPKIVLYLDLNGASIFGDSTKEKGSINAIHQAFAEKCECEWKIGTKSNFRNFMKEQKDDRILDELCENGFIKKEFADAIKKDNTGFLVFLPYLQNEVHKLERNAKRTNDEEKRLGQYKGYLQEFNNKIKELTTKEEKDSDERDEKDEKESPKKIKQLTTKKDSPGINLIDPASGRMDLTPFTEFDKANPAHTALQKPLNKFFRSARNLISKFRKHGSDFAFIYRTFGTDGKDLRSKLASNIAKEDKDNNTERKIEEIIPFIGFPDNEQMGCSLFLLSAKEGLEKKEDFEKLEELEAKTFTEAKKKKIPILVREKDKFFLYGDPKGKGDWQYTPITKGLDELNQLPPSGIIKRKEFTPSLIETLKVGHPQIEKHIKLDRELPPHNQRNVDRIMEEITPGSIQVWTDDYHYWNDRGQKHIGGKPYYMDPESDTIFMFFDDNVSDKGIIRVVIRGLDVETLGPVEEAKMQKELQTLLINMGWLVHVNTWEAATDPHYYEKKVDRVLRDAYSDKYLSYPDYVADCYRRINEVLIPYQAIIASKISANKISTQQLTEGVNALFVDDKTKEFVKTKEPRINKPPSGSTPIV